MIGVAAVNDSANGNTCSVSTTWGFRKVKISRRRNGQETRRRSRPSLRSLPKWEKNRSLSLSVRWLGGSEEWFEIRARGHVYKRPGWTCLSDVMHELYNDVD